MNTLYIKTFIKLKHTIKFLKTQTRKKKFLTSYIMIEKEGNFKLKEKAQIIFFSYSYFHLSRRKIQDI